MGKIFLELKNGWVKEMPDHTNWFYKKYNGNQSAILAYYDTVIKAACSQKHAGSMENIKEIARYTDDGIRLEVLVLDGRRL